MPRPTRASLATPNRDAILRRTFQALLFAVVLAVIYRYCWIDASDPFKCGALLNKGQWLDPGSPQHVRAPFQNWQPPGCMMHEYKKADIQSCFQKRRLVFIGDSTTRQIYWAVAKKMDQRRAQEEMEVLLDLEQKHMDLEFESGGVTVQFVWDPWMNSTGLDHELKKFRPNPSDEEIASGQDDSAGLILLGSPGLWFARHGQENYYKDFRDTIDRVIPYMDHATAASPMLPMEKPYPARHRSPNFLLLAPIQVPWYQFLSPSREKTITPEKIDLMNDYLQQVSAHSSADVVWSYSLMTWSGRGEYEESGLHVVDNVAHRKADVLLNLRCNADAAEKGYPFNRTCCSNYTPPGPAQWMIILAGMLVIPAFSVLRRKQMIRVGRYLPSADIMSAMTIFTLIICYCFYTDRTQVFEKEQKQFQKREFFTASFAALVAGIISIRKSKISIQQNQKTTSNSQDQGRFLSREQTDEWKGWMQCVILIYHYTRASQTLWIYEIVRLLVAAYLFMTGYGHTLYFLKREDYSLKRVASVLIRLNLLSCALPYMMRTDYLFYYFAPLVSFWFLVIYLTLKIGEDANMNVWFLLLKILLSAIAVTVFILVPGILESIATVLKYTCGVSWDVVEWRFRSFLDMYIVYIGMITAILYYRTSRLKSGSASPKTIIDSVLGFILAYPLLFKAFTVTLSLFLLPGYWWLTRRSPTKADFNWWQPYISCIPILSFVVLRNSHGILRSHHSSAFAWLGRFSLETYVLQYHIWLAGDSSGLLRLGLLGRWSEGGILTLLFIWVSWYTADATQKLTGWLVHGSDLSRNTYSPTSQDMDESGFKNTYLFLPRVSPDMSSTPSKDYRMSFGKGIVGIWMARLAMKLRDELRWRLLLILFVMWAANVTYR